MNRQFTQATVAIIGALGLVAATLITLVVDGLEDERQILVGGLIAGASASASWLFRLNGTSNHTKE